MADSPLTRLRLSLSRHLLPQRIFIGSFMALIALGAILLYMPVSAATKQLTFVDALFMSASAVCVTGLVVVDIGKDLSLTGQIITIVLFQLGGLGIITFSVFFFTMMGFGVSFKGREIIQSTFLHTPQRDFFRILKSVFIFTFIIEGIGTTLLYFRMVSDFPPLKALYYSIYHAISAFCNCGYSLFANSLENYRGDIMVNFVIMALLVLGGIGFVVLHELAAFPGSSQKRISVHTRVVLITSFVLVVLGACLFYVFERNFTLKDLPTTTKILVSIFQSVTARTCGFNTVDIGNLTNDTLLILLALMFIGASPGSTGGGIKTTSAAILFLFMWNRLKGNEETNVFHRTIPRDIVTKTISIIFVSAFCVGLFTSILLFAVPARPLPVAGRHLFIENLFESVSAFGTVGLSMGMTPSMNTIQKLTVTFLMFIGRVGPLTLALSLTLRRKKKSLVYAEETLMVG